MNEIELLLRKIEKDPSLLETAFGNPLSMKEELQLRSYDDALSERIDKIMNHAMVGTCEIVITDQERANVIDFLSLRSIIYNLLMTRADYSKGMEKMN